MGRWDDVKIIIYVYPLEVIKPINVTASVSALNGYNTNILKTILSQ